MKSVLIILSASLALFACKQKKGLTESSAAAFVHAIDTIDADKRETPVLQMLDIEMVLFAQDLNIEADLSDVYEAFESLDIKTYLRFNACAIFVQSRNGSFVDGYLLDHVKVFDRLPNLEDQYILVRSEPVSEHWRKVQLQELKFTIM